MKKTFENIWTWMKKTVLLEQTLKLEVQGGLKHVRWVKSLVRDIIKENSWALGKDKNI
jgi:hypothetical protein